MNEIKQRVREKVREHGGRLDIDTFGAIMDDCIRSTECGMLITKRAGSDEYTVQGLGCGSVLDFYFFLNAMRPIFSNMVRETGFAVDDVAELADELLEMLKDDLIEAVRNGGGAK